MKIACRRLHWAAESGVFDPTPDRLGNDSLGAGARARRGACRRGGYDNDEAVWESLGGRRRLRGLARADDRTLLESGRHPRSPGGQAARKRRVGHGRRRHSVVGRGIEDAAGPRPEPQTGHGGDLAALLGLSRSERGGRGAARTDSSRAMVETDWQGRGRGPRPARAAAEAPGSPQEGWIDGVRHGRPLFPDRRHPFVRGGRKPRRATSGHDDDACQLVTRMRGRLGRPPRETTASREGPAARPGRVVAVGASRRYAPPAPDDPLGQRSSRYPRRASNAVCMNGWASTRRRTMKGVPPCCSR